MSVAIMDVEKARFNMIQQQIRPWEVLDPTVLELLSEVRRECFVPEQYKDLAFADVEIPLAADDPSQKMLQPRVEARMLQELRVRHTDKVLEIGTGSGYMAALLAAKAEFVYSVEINPSLVDFARQNLEKNGVVNVSVDEGDASSGWDLYAPYDAIMVSASLTKIPDCLLQSLKVGGRLAAFVGQLPVMQAVIVTRTGDSTFSTQSVFETAVAPLIHAGSSVEFSF